MFSRKTTISAAALIVGSAGAAAAFPATATTDLNVRSGPGTGYSVVDQLEAGDTVEIVATQGSWYRTAEGGWASGSYLDAEGGQTTSYYDDGGYGAVAFYYDDSPYYWDNAGYYFYIDGGRRHRVGWDWFRGHNHRDFRWSNDRYRRDFEGRRGNWDGDRSASRDGDRNWDGQRGDGQRVRRGNADVSVEREQSLQTNRASSVGGPGEGQMGGQRRGGEGGPRAEGPRRAGGGQGGGGAVLPRQGDIPGGGY